MARIIDGNAHAQRLGEDYRLEVAELWKRAANPALAVVLVGQDPASAM